MSTKTAKPKTARTGGKWRLTSVPTRLGVRHYLHLGDNYRPEALVAVVQGDPADVRLMATAPELAEALASFLKLHGNACRCPHCAAARKALAKAGE